MRRFLPIFLTLVLASAAAPGGAALARAASPEPPAVPRADVSGFETGADSNRTWPAGWVRGGNQPLAQVRLVTPGHAGSGAVLLSTPQQQGYVALVRVLPDSLRSGAGAVRLTAWIRTEGAGRAFAWVHLISPTGTIPSDESSDRWPGGTTDWTRYEVLVPVLPEVQQVVFGAMLSGGGSLWVDDVVLEALGPDQVPPSSPAASAYLDAGLDSLCRRSVLSPQLNWGVLQRAARTQLLGAKVPADAYDALRYALRRLDPEGELIPPSKLETASPGPAAVPENHIEADGMLGVIRIPKFATGSRAQRVAAADTIRKVIARLHALHVRGWVVDLQAVSGGEVAPALAGLGPLLGEGTLFGWLRPNGRRGAWTHHHGLVVHTPGAPPENRLQSSAAPGLQEPDLPVAVLIGPRTAGAGEAVALAFRGRANTRLLGQPTAGRGNVRERIRLGDGAVLRFETGQLTDRSGWLPKGAITPDDTVSTSPASLARDSLTTLGLQWVRGRAAERR